MKKIRVAIIAYSGFGIWALHAQDFTQDQPDSMIIYRNYNLQFAFEHPEKIYRLSLDYYLEMGSSHIKKLDTFPNLEIGRAHV